MVPEQLLIIETGDAIDGEPEAIWTWEQVEPSAPDQKDTSNDLPA